MRTSLGIAVALVVALASACRSGDDGTERQAVVAALDAMQDGEAREAWNTLHPDEQKRTDAAAFAACVDSQLLSPDAEKAQHRVRSVHDEVDPVVAGHTIIGEAKRVTVEFWTSEAEIRGGGPILDFYAFHLGGAWRWADPHLDVANCARLPIE